MIFDWDADNLRHIARHRVTPEEVEQALWNDPVDAGIQYDEGDGIRLFQVGGTATGRILGIITTLRDERIRPITAWDADKRDKLVYLQSRMKRP